MLVVGLAPKAVLPKVPNENWLDGAIFADDSDSVDVDPLRGVSQHAHFVFALSFWVIHSVHSQLDPFC